MARLFFALWPDAGARDALAACGARIAASAGGRAVPAAKLHLTLAFLGEVAADRAAALREAAGEVEARAFRLELDEIGSFRRSGVAWAGCRVPPPGLSDLQADLAGRLARRGFEGESRAYAPHLTLVRRIAAPVAREAIDPVSWRVAAFSLVETLPAGGGYATVAEWRLRDGGT
ncbi:MAG: RNA 2',3'-cyclic phosphodiesterase [Burkholderiales bacterium]